MGDLLVTVGYRVIYTRRCQRCSPTADTLCLCAIVLIVTALCAAVVAYTHEYSQEMAERRRFLLRISDDFAMSSYVIELVMLVMFLFACTLHDNTCACTLDGDINEKLSLMLTGAADVTQYVANDIVTPLML